MGNVGTCANPSGNFNLPSITLNRAATPATAVFTISGPVNVTEGGATANAVVTCTGALDGNNTPITVPYSLTNASGNFSTSPASPLTFNACPSTQNIVVMPRPEDTMIQGAQSGTITLGSPSAGSLGTPFSATVNVADNDNPPTVSVSASGTCGEPTTNCSFTVTATSNTTPAQTGSGPSVPFTLGGTATNSTDYVLRLGSGCGGAVATSPVATTFGTPTTLTVCTVDDAAVEPTETVVLTLTSGTGYTLGTASATVNIIDNDVQVTVTPTGTTEGGNVIFTINCTGPSGVSVSGLNFSLSGVDAGAGPSTPLGPALGPLTCGTPITVTQPTVNDTIIGNNRSVTLTLSGGTASNGGAVVLPTGATGANVADDDQPTQIPTLGAFGLGLMALLIAALAGLGRRRFG